MEKATQTARTLLMVAVMIAAAIVPMAPEAVELRDEARAMGASITTDVTSLTLDEGGSNWYEVSLDEAPDGTLVITPSSDNSVVTLDPSYIKFTKVNWDMPQYIWVDIADTDDDGADTTATISHSISGSDTVFASASIGDVSVTGTDYDVDTDGDGLHDGLDTDDDGDGIGDDNDAFPLDSTEDTDTDGDGTGDNADTDDDGDGTTDADDWAPLDDSEDTDTDGDGTGDNADIDDDGDGVNDSDEDDGCDLLVDCDGDGVNDDTDAFDSDANESADADGDGIGDNADEFDSDATEDTDTDGDGVGDNGDAFPDDASETTDTDGDGVGDNGDAFPNDASETTDTDGDGVGDNSDWNATDSTESNDNDGDGVGDNADTDDDDDGVLDVDEEDASSLDLDGDGTADGIDCAMVSDCDGDGYDDASDAFDADPEAWDDFDGDGLADTFPNLLVQDSGNYGCDLPDSPMSWTSIECSFVLPDEGEDLLFTIDTDSWGYEAAMVVTDPDGVSTTYNGFASNSILTVTIASAAAGDWNVELTDSYGDGGTSVVVTYGSYTAGEAWLGEMIVPSTSGYGTDLDNDDDDDGFSDADEDTCGTDSMNSTDVPTDTDSDGLCDAGVDDDDDDDGVLDSDEEAGCDLLTDCDGDGVGDATDSHDNDATETSDMDGDGIGDNSDDDRDGDGYLNSNDEFPDDDSEWNDNDGDGTGDNADTDDDTCPEADGTDDDGDGTADHTCGTFTGLGSTMGYDFYPGDGVADVDDAFPMTPAESADNDGDGWGDNADADDDNDGISDSQDDDMDGDGFTNDDEDTNCVGDGGDSTSAGTTPDDMDGDGTCDYLDADTDGDGTDDTSDAYPEDACADTDTDGDGMPDTLVAGCTTTLTEDDDDDFDSSQAPSVTFTVTVSDDYSDGGMVAYVQVDGTTVCGPLEDDGSTSTTCDVTIYAGEVMEVSAECDYYDYAYDEGAITVSDGFSFSGAYDVTCYYAAGAGDYVIHTINGDDHITALTWTDADEATCGTDPLDSTDEPTDTDSDNLCDDAQDDDNDGDGFSNADETTNCFDSTTSTGTDPLDSTDAPTDTDDDGVCDYVDTDDDDDGVADADDAFPLDSTEDTDTDGDGTGDNTDTDDDGDGTADTDDAFPLDASEDTDTDGNGTGDNADTDDDGDGTADTDDAFPLDLCVDTDTDGDGIANDLFSNCVVDTTASGSGISSISIDATSGEPSITIGEAFETNATDSSCDASISWHTYNFATGTWDHVDSSGLCNGDDYDVGDTLTCYSYWGTCDEHDNYRATLTGNGTGVSVSYVGDFTVPDTDDDDDGDGVSDADDAFPLDSTETIDTDGDGTGDTADTDDDGDGVADADEADGSGLTVATDCTLVTDCDGDGVSDADEADGSALDLDGDGTADGIHCAVDTDCDDDGTTDDTDAFPIDATETSDMDGDGIGDNTDDDRDGDGLSNAWDACPDDSSGYTDTDGDGACDESDTDDDGDGTPDADDAFPLDASEDTDTDGDGVGDNSDADDDNDGTDDQGDECPLDASGITDNDSDGVCDVTDDDDDNDTVLDADEVSGCEFIADCDGDGVDDSADAFDLDPDASTDTDGDGLADTVSNTAFTSGTFNLSWTAGSMTYSVGIFGASYGADGSTEEVCLEGYQAAGTWSQGAGYCLMDLEEGGGLAITVYCPYTTCYSDISVVDPAGSTTLLVDSSESPKSGEKSYRLLPASAAGTQQDPDDDGDSYPDVAEDTLCVGEGGDSLDDTVTPTDTDGDSVCDSLDDDDDNDGYTDSHETADCGTDPLTAGDVVDTDFDGICNVADDDDDNDGVLDDDDWAPLDASEWADTDGDGTGDNEDDDADGDGTPDTDDVDPTDRCSILDTDGDGLTDSYHDCSDMGFYSTLDSDAGDNAGEGFDDGDLVGITDDTTLFGGAAAGNQWFQVSDTDGVFRMYFDHATGVSAVSMWIALASTDYEEEDYYASYWVGDDGTTTELGNSQNSWGDIDNCWCEGFWGQWVVEVPSEDGYLMLEASNDDDAERWGLDNVAYHDSNWDVISMVTFEDSVAEMGVYTTPSSPALLDGTYTVQIDDSYGDGGHAITVTSGGTTLCAIADDYSATASCTFDLVAYSDEEIDISIDSDSWPYEGTLTVTFNDGSTAVETWSADTSFSYGHVGDALFEQEGDYSIAVSDSWGDGGHGIEAAFNGESVCSIAQYDYSSGATCTFTGVGFPDSVLTVDVDTDFYPSEGSMTVTFPDGTTVTETWSGDTSFSYASHSGTDIVPVAGEVMLSNGHGATVSLDTSSYHTGTVDDDDDNDGYADVDDAFPTDDTEWDDMDGDGVGSNTDNDDDGDGVNDGVDDFPRHAHATTDTDGDGMPDEIGMTDGEIHEDFEIGNFTGMNDYSDWKQQIWGFIVRIGIWRCIRWICG